MITKKRILLVIVFLIVVEVVRGMFYELSVKDSMIKVINYLEEHKTIDNNLISNLENEDKVILRYELVKDDTYNITLSKRHIILFFISRNIELKQKYIVSRLSTYNLI